MYGVFLAEFEVVSLGAGRCVWDVIFHGLALPQVFGFSGWRVQCPLDTRSLVGVA